MIMTKIRYFIKQKSWYRNMRKIIMNYLHMSEANDFYTIQMALPKERIDRVVCDPRVWRWKL